MNDYNMSPGTEIAENIARVNDNLQKHCTEAKRAFQDVTLIAVSKTKPVEALRLAYEQNVRDFGENKVQELMDKIPQLPEDVRWHMIGHLQRNKVKYIVDKVYMIHSVDSLSLAREISKEAKKRNVTVPVLLEINIAGEESKYGIKAEEALELTEQIASLEGIQIKGLMCVPPYVEDAEENRIYFTKLRKLAVDIAAKNIDNVCMDVLSMGMSGDYCVAVEEGATHVRVGTGIFGERQYNL